MSNWDIESPHEQLAGRVEACNVLQSEELDEVADLIRDLGKTHMPRPKPIERTEWSGAEGEPLGSCPFLKVPVCVQPSLRGSWIPQWIVRAGRGVDPGILNYRWSSMARTEEEVRALSKRVRGGDFGHKAAMNSRKLNHYIAEFLGSLYRRTKETGEEWHHIDDLETGGGGDYAKVSLWGLACQRPKPGGVTWKTESGVWRISETGTAWVEGRVTLPRGSIEVKQKGERFWVVGYTQERITFKDAFKEAHDHEKLMGNTGTTTLDTIIKNARS